MKSRRTSKKTHTTYAGRVVYDRKPHMFTIKDVIRIARKADYTNVTYQIFIDLAKVNFYLITRAYGQMLANGLHPLGSLWALFDLIRELIGQLSNVAAYYGVDIFAEWKGFLKINYGLTEPVAPPINI